MQLAYEGGAYSDDYLSPPEVTAVLEFLGIGVPTGGSRNLELSENSLRLVATRQLLMRAIRRALQEGRPLPTLKNRAGIGVYRHQFGEPEPDFLSRRPQIRETIVLADGDPKTRLAVWTLSEMSGDCERLETTLALSPDRAIVQEWIFKKGGVLPCKAQTMVYRDGHAPSRMESWEHRGNQWDRYHQIFRNTRILEEVYDGSLNLTTNSQYYPWNTQTLITGRDDTTRGIEIEHTKDSRPLHMEFAFNREGVPTKIEYRRKNIGFHPQE